MPDDSEGGAVRAPSDREARARTRTPPEREARSMGWRQGIAQTPSASDILAAVSGRA